MRRFIYKTRVLGLLLLLSPSFLTACEDDSRATRTPGAAETLEDERPIGSCDDLPTEENLKEFMREAVRMGQVGGLANGRNEWAAVVDRNGRVCAIVASTDTVTTPWPGSQGIALAKAYTANAFSTDTSPASTARLYTLSQPGFALYGAGAGNPIHPDCLAAPADAGKQEGRVCGGTIVFGGGLPLYRDNTVIGGLGLSGDTPCADHELAKRVRELARLVPPQGSTTDDIIFPGEDGASIYGHPLCRNTWRNGQRIGDVEPPEPQARDTT